MDVMLEKRTMVDMHTYVIMPNHIHFLMVVSDDDKDNFKNQSVSSIIGSYKAAVSKECHKHDLSFGRQTSFYEHVIRNEASYEQIHYYIESNIENREKDKFYQDI
jgi:putative transposase